MKDIQIIPINERKQIEFDWIRGGCQVRTNAKLTHKAISKVFAPSLSGKEKSYTKRYYKYNG